MNKFLLFLAYLFKWGGLIGALWFMFAIFILSGFGGDSANEEIMRFIYYILVFITLFVTGIFWSKKLLRKQYVGSKN